MSARFVPRSLVTMLLAFAAFDAFASPLEAQMLPNPYGLAIALDNAKNAAAPALAEARKNNWTMAAAIVASGGDLADFEEMDGTQTGRVDVAIAKARAAGL